MILPRKLDTDDIAEAGGDAVYEFGWFRWFQGLAFTEHRSPRLRRIWGSSARDRYAAVVTAIEHASQPEDVDHAEQLRGLDYDGP